MVNKNIPINKGNYDMDTELRNEIFERYRGEGWEKEYKEYRRKWVELAKEQRTEEYPLLVDIELSTLCNLKCPMCYTLTDEFRNKVPHLFMDWDLFTKIVDEIAGKVPAVRLSLRGEPTLHPNFVECIKYCKDNGIKEVSFLTNGSKLNVDFFVQIAEAGADWITVSIDGVDEQYENIRKPLKFNDTYDNLKKISEIKKKKGWHRPVVKVQGIWPAIKNNPTDYYERMSKVADLVAFNPLIDYLDMDEDIIYDDDFACPQLYQRMVIGADGKVMPCSNDEGGRNILGDVSMSSIYDIWNSAEFNKFRKKHVDGKFKEIEVCKLCYLPRKTEDNESATVGSRQLIIKNYVGRSQNIGE